MIFKMGKFLSYVMSGVCFCLAVYWFVGKGFSVMVILFLAGGILFYEYSDYLDFARVKAKQSRTTGPCLHCRSTGKIGGRRCPRCGGKGYVSVPKDKGRPPIT